MTVTEHILAVVALVCLAVSLAIIGWFVPDIDLIIVLVVVMAMAIYDFFIYRPKKA
jgi:hypothetical protein